ncbi:MAG TPA: hypothetical protein VGK99_22595 [Acidobacteriota bacterium]
MALLLFSLRASAAGHKEWAELVQSLSEPGGYFDSDNFVSNESSYLTVLDRMRELQLRSGVYIGVGPDQNFSYITQVRPEQAFIIDIRRQNLLQHLMFKALMERARSRLEYLALLVSRPVKLPPDLGRGLTVDQIVDRVDAVENDPSLFQKNLESLQARIARYRLPLSQQDRDLIAYIYRNFYENALNIRYKSFGREHQYMYPDFRALVLARDLSGAYGNYLASEEGFQWLKRFQQENRLVPLTGDLAGKLAMRKLARYLVDTQKTVRAFYVSNVEFYLFRNGVFESWVENVRALPADEQSIIIRSYFSYGVPHPEQVDPYWMASVMQRIRSFLREQEKVPYTSYRDLATRDFISIRTDH